eukprot:TRINITY_DN2412_c0_g3_i1.p1 TRINITY_DN2412_c0_g3~~TRINITY_DN2412_c0_g3_i1.p1  ORF type:complete len:608 (+),score=137.29 TRINITY_DN2412_c0_g3_i1:168-1826(+)
MSVAPSTGSTTNSARKSSGLSSGGTKSTKATDPRDISSKQFQSNAKKLIIEYLVQHGYDQPINAKVLTSPSLKEYTMIFQFLCRQFDPNAKFTQKIEEDVMFLLKKLRYPFQISKHVFQSLGSMHSWPNLLAATSWIVELLIYEEVASKSKTFDPMPNSIEKQFFELTSSAYLDFLHGGETRQDLPERLKLLFEEQIATFQMHITKLREDNSRMAAIVHAATKQPSQLEQLAQEKAVLTLDNQKFDEAVQKMLAYKNGSLKALDQAMVDLAKKESEISMLIKEKDEQQKILDAQVISTIDVQRFQHQQHSLSENYKNLLQEKQSLQQQILDLELLVERKAMELGPVLDKYAKLADEIMIIPASAKNSQGQDLRIEVDYSAPIGNVLKTDIRGFVRPFLISTKERFMETSRAYQIELSELEMRIEAGEESVHERSESITNAEARFRALESRYNQEKEAMGDEIKSHTEELEVIEGEVDLLQKAQGESAPKLEQMLAALMREHEILRAQQEAEKLEAQNAVMSALEMLANHKAHVEKELRELESRMLAFLSSTS